MVSDAYHEAERAVEEARIRLGMLAGRPPSHCRSCGAAIVFCHVQRKDGSMAEKMMPVDLGIHHDGNLVPLSHEKGLPTYFDGRGYFTVRIDPKGFYRSHFQSCPEAKKHRSGKKAKR
jgi:hypothetical protein